MADYRTTLAGEADAGRVVAKRQYAEIAGQVRRWTGQEGSSGDFFANLVAEAPEARRDELARRAGAASAAYADLGRWLETELAPRGRDREAAGRERYALASREFLGAAVDLEETYQWGWEELKRLTDDMVATSNRIVPGGSVSDAVAALDADPARRLGSREEFRDWMQAARRHAPSPTSPTCTSTSPSRSAGSSAAWRRPTTAASTTRVRRRTSPGRGGCGGRCPTASTR